MICNLSQYIPLINEALQIIALLIGSSWALYRFIKFRRLSPKLDNNNEVELIRIEGNKAYIRVKIIVKNIGEVAIKNFTGKVSICDFSKITDEYIQVLNNNNLPNEICLYDFNLSEFDYIPELIEPGEKDFFIKTLCVTNLPSVLEIHSHIENVHYKRRARIFKKEKETTVGWTNATIHTMNTENYGKE